MRDAEERRRLVMRLKGFSSTLRRRDLCKASGSCVRLGVGMCCQTGKLTFLGLIEQFVGRHGVERVLTWNGRFCVLELGVKGECLTRSKERTLKFTALLLRHGIDESESSNELK